MSIYSFFCEGLTCISMFKLELDAHTPNENVWAKVKACLKNSKDLVLVRSRYIYLKMVLVTLTLNKTFLDYVEKNSYLCFVWITKVGIVDETENPEVEDLKFKLAMVKYKKTVGDKESFAKSERTAKELKIAKKINRRLEKRVQDLAENEVTKEELEIQREIIKSLRDMLLMEAKVDQEQNQRTRDKPVARVYLRI